MRPRPITETEYADHLAAMADREARDRAEFEATTDADVMAPVKALLMLALFDLANHWWLGALLVLLLAALTKQIFGGRK